MLRGESDAALAAFNLAIPLLDDAVRLGNAHLNRGGVRLQRNAARPALTDFRAAEELYASAGDDYNAAKAKHNTGYALLLEGDLIGALRELDEAYRAFVIEGPVMTAMADQDRAEALLAAGLVDEALDALSRAAAAYGRRRLPQRQAEAELVIARTTLAVDPRRAAVMARRARTRFDRTDSPAWRDRADAVVLAAEVELGRGGPRLLAHGDALARRLERHGLHAAASTTTLHVARALVRRGDLDGATTRLRRVRRRSQQVPPPLDVRLLDRDTRASLDAARGRRSPALAEVRAGLADLHAWQSSFGSLDLQTNVVGHGVRLAARGLRLAAGSSSAAVVFEWSERARMLASRVQPVRAPQDEQALADLAELRAGADPTREAELRQRVRERAWQHRGSGAVTDPVPLDRLQAALGGDPALVAYVVADPDVVALVVTRDAAVRCPLGDRAALEAVLAGLPADLDLAAADLPGPVAATVRRGLTGRLEALAAAWSTRSSTSWATAGSCSRRPGSSPACRGRCCAGGGAARHRRSLRDQLGGRAGAPGRTHDHPRPGRLRRGSRRPARGRGGHGRGDAGRTHGCWWGRTRRPRPPPPSPPRSTSCTSPPTAGTPPTARCSPGWSWPTGRGTATTSTSCRRCPRSSCCRPARWGARRCGTARS